MMYSGGSVYIPEPEANNANRIFNYNLSYCKAGAVIKMLRWELQDDDVFWQILNNYLTKYKDDFATTQDFQDVVEEITGSDFGYFFDQWIYGEGYPTLHGYWYQQEDSLTIKINEHTSQTSVTSEFKMLIPIIIEFENGGDTLIIFSQVQRNQVHKVYLPVNVEGIVVDPNNELLNGEGSFINYNPNGIGNNELISCSVYPNPFTDKVKISISDKHSNFNITIYDGVGRKVFSDKTSQQDYILNSSEFQTGMYYLEVRSVIGFYGQKILKN